MESASGSIGHWYGDPMSVEEARALLDRAHVALQAAYRSGADGLIVAFG